MLNETKLYGNGTGLEVVCLEMILIFVLQNQDPVVGNLAPILGIDAWEHAY